MSGGTPSVGKVGRNDPCPCGSGLKYKWCHGSVVDPKLSVGDAPLNATAAGAILGGFPGQHQQFHAIFRFKDGDPRNNLPVMGAPGDYEVIFVLRRPGFPLLPERQISFSVGHLGDSHLAITKPAFTPPGNPDADQILIQATNEDGHFEFIGTPNKKGFLGKFTARPFRARDRQEKREDWMVHRVEAEMANYASGLFIIGVAHMHSLFAKLRAAGFGVTAYTWLS